MEDPSSIAAGGGGTKERRWDPRNPVRRKATRLICSSKPKIPPPPKLRSHGCITNARSWQATLRRFPLCSPRHVSRIVIKEHAKRSSDDAISQLPAMLLEPCSQMLPPTPHAHGPDPTVFFGAACSNPAFKMQGAARPHPRKLSLGFDRCFDAMRLSIKFGSRDRRTVSLRKKGKK
jgi:hypothetical protein